MEPTPQPEDSSIEKKIEKLRDELIETRVDNKAWVRNLKMLALIFSIGFPLFIALLTFFGYNKIESIESTILEKSSRRLAKTDSLLSQIDVKRIDELNRKLKEKQREYEVTLSNFEKVLSKNKELEEKLLQSLPVNERVDFELKQWYQATSEDLFDVRVIKTEFQQNETAVIYLTFADKFKLAKANLLCLMLMENKPKGFLLKRYFFKVQQRLNKLSITFDVGKGEYILEIGFIEVLNGKNTFYRSSKTLKVE